MNILKEAIGILLIFISWFNPFSLSLPIRIAIFILGFDTMSLFLKAFLFVLYFFFPLLGESVGFLLWTLIILVVVETVVLLLGKESILKLILKPLAVFATLFVTLNDLQLALIAAGIDLVLNLKH